MSKTKHFYIQSDHKDTQQTIALAVDMLKNGQTVAIPTETVYGLGADATNEAAVQNIFKAKGRPADNPLIAHVATKEQLQRLTTSYPDYVDELIGALTPGPITFVLPSNGTCATNVTAGLDTIGIRMPDHPVTHQLLKELDLPVAAPSANLSGKPSPTTAAHVLEDLDDRIDGIIDAGPTGVGLESTVIDCTSSIPVILRPGGVTKEQLEALVGEVKTSPSLAQQDNPPKAPGMKYRHYSPDVPLILVEGDAHAMQDMIEQMKQSEGRIGVIASSQRANMLEADKIVDVGDNLQDIATHLYGALRQFKKDQVDIILCETFEKEGLGAAVMNRLRKAATDTLRRPESF